MFALTKRSAASAYDYAPRYGQPTRVNIHLSLLTVSLCCLPPTISKKVRVRTKLNDTYLMDFSEALLEPKLASGAVDTAPTPAEAATLSAPVPAPAPADVVMGGHPVPSAPGLSIAGEDSAAEKPSFVDLVAKEAEEELALKKRKMCGDCSSLTEVVSFTVALHARCCS
jgi:hypothetical protein